MKKYFIYQAGNGSIFIAKSRNCRIGNLIGSIKGVITDKAISKGYNKGDVVCLINDERIEIDSVSLVDKTTVLKDI